MQKKDWHALTAEQSLDAVDAGRDGLSVEQAQKRLRKFGPKRLRPPHRRGPFMQFVAQLHNVLIYVLFVAAVFAVLLRDYLDAGVILGVVFVSEMLTEVQTLTTSLLRQIAQFTRWLTAAILVLAGFTFAYGYFVQSFLW